MSAARKCAKVTVAFSALLSFVGAAALAALAGLPWWTGVLAWFAALLCSVGLDARALRAREAGHGGAGAGGAGAGRINGTVAPNPKRESRGNPVNSSGPQATNGHHPNHHRNQHHGPSPLPI